MTCLLAGLTACSHVTGTGAGAVVGSGAPLRIATNVYSRALAPPLPH